MKTRRIIIFSLLCILQLVTVSVQATAAGRASALSRWLSLEAVPSVRRQLQEHPRYRGQQVRLVRQSGDALTDAVARVLLSALPALGSRQPTPVHATGLPVGSGRSVDSLECQPDSDDYRLQVIVSASGWVADVELAMVEVGSGILMERWRWRGGLTADERQYSRRSLASARPSGDLAAPWGGDDVAAAAAALSREFVCGLRPYTVGITALQWPETNELPPGLLSDTVSASRHFIGAYRELDLVGSGSGNARDSWRVEVRASRFDSGTWQLWLIAVPADSSLPGVQAVTYLAAGVASQEVTPARPARAVGGMPVRRNPAAGPGLDPAQFLRLELLGVTRSEYGAGAELQLRLRLRNEADHALAYGLKSSAGYFEHCRATSEHYRHQVWGRIAGVLKPGETRVERIVLRSLRHAPRAPGTEAVCAGFGDLDGFRNYQRSGAGVTDYLHWDL